MTNSLGRIGACALVLSLCLGAPSPGAEQDSDDKSVRVFIFAGQSNMEGADSKSGDIKRFPPFAGLEASQEKVLFSYQIGADKASKGWVALQPVGTLVGPELSFARAVSRKTKAPLAIIKCAYGGTTLGEDWNPDTPGGKKLYPSALKLIQSSLAELDQKRMAYRIEGFMWHQGENDMFNEGFRTNYGANLKNFVASWRRDLKTPGLKFYIGELCTKSVWGMDNRPNMYAIRAGQKSVTEADPLAVYVPTSHDAMEIGGGAGLHYHYGTLGQLEHGVNYADAYLRATGRDPAVARPLKTWPYKSGSPVKLFILAGHRNMEGERAFALDLASLAGQEALAKDNDKIAYKYSIGGGYKISAGWEPLGPGGPYGTFGPELSFGKALAGNVPGHIAIAKFTHSGSQMNDWTPQGTEAKDRNLYPKFIAFVRESIQELEAKGHAVELAGIFYHVGENDMALGQYRSKAAGWLQATVAQSRLDLASPSLTWYVSEQPPTEDPRAPGLNAIDVMAQLAAVAAKDPAFIHLPALDLPKQQEKLVLTTAGILQLGEILAGGYLKQK